MKWWLERVPKEKLVLSWAGLVFIQKYFLRTEKPAALNKCFKEMKSKIASKLFFKKINRSLDLTPVYLACHREPNLPVHGIVY